MKRHIKSYLELGFSLIIVFGIIFAVLWQVKPQADSTLLKIDFLNVGQGDSEYIKTPEGKDILIDGGPDNSVLKELGEVMSSSDHEINLVILSHPHADHLTGLVEVLKRFKVDEVWESGVNYPSATYDEFEKEIQNQKIPKKIVKIGDQENFDNVKLSVLYPLSSLEKKTIDNLNNSSIVVRLDYLSFSALFPGDLEKDANEKMLSENIDDLNVTVLKVGHHGSKNGTSESFLKIVRPAIAVISVGYKNTYGHPHAAILNLFKSLAVKYYRTDQDGRVEISTNGQTYSVETFSN